jgi:hypothetical protein
MAILRTTSCRRHRHPEFRITYDPALVPVEGDARWFVGWLEEAVAGGERFAAGQTCQVGWVVTEFRASENSTLALWEPDMWQFPVAWVESVSYTLAHLRRQKDVCESVLTADDLLFPSMLQSAIICTRLGQTPGVVMERSAPSASDSGWFCGCSGEGHDHNTVGELRKVSLYHAAVRYAPRIVPFLALPEGVLCSKPVRARRRSSGTASCWRSSRAATWRCVTASSELHGPNQPLRLHSPGQRDCRNRLLFGRMRKETRWPRPGNRYQTMRGGQSVGGKDSGRGLGSPRRAQSAGRLAAGHANSSERRNRCFR